MIDELIWPKPKANHKDLDVKINWVRRKFRSMGFFTDYHTKDVCREVHFVPPKDFKDFESLVLVATWRGITSLEGLFE